MIPPPTLSFWPTTPNPANSTLLDRGLLRKPLQKLRKGPHADSSGVRPSLARSWIQMERDASELRPNKECVPRARFGTMGQSYQWFLLEYIALSYLRMFPIKPLRCIVVFFW